MSKRKGSFKGMSIDEVHITIGKVISEREITNKKLIFTRSRTVHDLNDYLNAGWFIIKFQYFDIAQNIITERTGPVRPTIKPKER